ncbi:hydantoinase/oxoprolinase family protein [Rhizobium sp. CG5]|uniref:hydantoinase/oxoprolinase family protein n=1 Tax=Rhizobium sp. CG5 TaxID=2726076 RepID=UPI00203475BD|nr:hydantoinase/oxoprolinase family protein [Rhizobium sp. CG5]MCM2476388.1 hydantoinase/oxoprolinase family protein [Rhizobium sp. CG5]
MHYRLGIDIGGTFTDFVAYDESGAALKAWKNLSTPADPVEGVITGLRAFGAIEAIDSIRLGTTVATNALLEGKGARVAYVTTKGFRDIPFIARGNRKHHFDLAWVKPKPFLRRRDAFEVCERVNALGEILVPLDEEEVRDIADEIAASGDIEAVAVMLMHSYLTPDHEQQIKAIFAEVLPDMPVSISYEVLPKWKEHYRSSTTICDAYIKPVVRTRIGSMQRRLEEEGIAARLVIMRSNGGEMSADAVADAPIQIAMSGPTGGVIAARQMAHRLGLDNLVTLDMGGTSTDVSTVVDGREKFTTDFEIEWGRPIQVPMIDIRTIGAGGGSIARIDNGGMLVVGPESAGARPGPACYGRGGTLPTVTDANVVLGRISARNFLGGEMSLDAGAARAAVAPIADVLSISIEEAALSMVRIANNTMVGALHTVLTEQGLDPRDFVLVAFGGAGPLHVSDLMDDASIPRGLVPNFPGQFSAFGFTMADSRVDRYRTVQLNSRAFDRARARVAMDTLTAECLADLSKQGHDQAEIFRSVEMRYLGQNYELEIPIPAGDFDADHVASVFESFHTQHEARFGFRLEDHVELINFLVTGVARTGEVVLPEIDASAEPPVPVSVRPVYFSGGWRDTPVYDRPALKAEQTISGPALIEENASVTVLDPGKTLSVDRYGNLLVTAF